MTIRIALLLLLVGCGGTASLQSAQLAVSTPATTTNDRQYSTWCSRSCVCVVSEHRECGEISDAWQPPPPLSPYQDVNSITPRRCQP